MSQPFFSHISVQEKLTDFELYLLRKHGWFKGEDPGTIWFKPDSYMPENETKSVLRELIQSRISKPISLSAYA